MEVAWILSAFVLGLLARQIGLPSLVGFLVAGFALSRFGYVTVPALEHLAELGVELLLFTVGLKLRFKSVFRPEVFGGALFHLLLSTALVAPALLWLTDLNNKASVLLAIGLGFSSTVVAVKVLEQKRELRAFHGRVSIGILIVQDLVAIALLSISSGQSPSTWALLLFGLPLLRPVLFKLIDWSGHDELLALLGLACALVLGGALFKWLGLSAELGALALGALLAGHPRAKEMSDSLWGLKEIFLVGFFLKIGLLGLPDIDMLWIAALLMLLLPIKAVLFFYLLLLFGLRARTAFLSALSLANFSEFALIVVHVGTDAGLFDAQVLVLMAIAVSFSFMISAPLNRFAHELYQRYEKPLLRFERNRRHPDDSPLSLGSATVLILGMGRVGSGAYDFLSSRDFRVVGLDSDPGKVEQQIGEGRRVVYADAEDPGLWTRLKLDYLQSVMLAVPDLEAKCMAARELRRVGFTGLISSTNVYPEEESAILEAGCDLTFNYFNEAGVGFAEHVFEAMHPATNESR